MIHEYAVDPGAVFKKDGFWSVLKDFGIAQGRVIVECPDNDWRKQLEQSLCRARSEFGDVGFLRLMERWKELIDRKGVIRRKPDSVNSAALNWLQKIVPEHCHTPFHAVLTNETDDQIPELLSKQDIDLGDPRWNAETQKIVPRTVEALAECVALLGQVSCEILFIDPYFSEGRKWQESLLKSLTACRAHDRHFGRIEVHTSEYDEREKESRLTNGQQTSKLAVFKRDLAPELSEKLTNDISVKFFIWKPRRGGDRYHRRYVLTERGGIYFEGGLDRGAEGHTTDVGLLSDKVWQERWEQYQWDEDHPEAAAFDLVGEPFVIKSCR